MTTADEVAMVTGGLRVGRNAWLCIAASWGFGVLEISRERLVFDTTWTRYAFTHDTIVRLWLRRGFWYPGLRIEHSVAAYPRYLALHTRKVDLLRRHLEDAGYSVYNAKA